METPGDDPPLPCGPAFIRVMQQSSVFLADGLEHVTRHVHFIDKNGEDDVVTDEWTRAPQKVSA